MKIPPPRPAHAFCPVLMAAGLFTASALTPLHAGILAYEGFDYTPDAALGGLAGGQGWAAPWTVINAAGGSLNVVGGSLVAGANAPAGFDAKSTGQSVNLISNYRAGRLLDTSAAGAFGQAGYIDGGGMIGADGKTLYLSFLQQADGTSLFYEFEFHRGDLGDPGRIAGIGNDQAGDDVNLRAPAGTHTPLGPGNFDVNFYVVRIDFQEGNDDIRVWQNPVSATEPDEATLALTGQADMSFDGLSFGAFLNARQVAHDELRIGESWQDVMSAVVNPPAAPLITGQPQGMFSYTGGTVRLTAAVTGNPAPALRWFHNDVEIPGKTDPELILTNVQTADAGNYKLTATNASGTATSDTATVTVQARPAGLIAYEGFDYAAGTANLPGQNGGLGWAEPWQAISGAGQSVTDGSLTAGVHAPSGYDSQSHGNQVNLPNGQRDGRFLDTTPEGPFGALGYVDDFGNIGADGKTLYLSFMQQPNGTSLFYELEFHRGDLGDPGRIGGIGNDQAGSNVNLRAPGGVHTLIGPGSTDVNFYVVRIDFQEGDDDIRVYRNTTSGTEPAEPDLTLTAQADMSFNGLSMGAFVNGRTVRHDEIRLGETWASVVPNPSVPAVAPQILTQPLPASDFEGGSVRLAMSVSGTPAPALQWFHGAQALAGGTGPELILTGLKPSDAGDYRLVATNSAGSATSGTVTVTVLSRPAGLLAYEGFDYPVGAESAGQAGGGGWAGPWQTVDNGGFDLVADSLTAGGGAPAGYDALSKGNHSRLISGRRPGRLLDTGAEGIFGSRGFLDLNGNIGADGRTLYVSFLQQPEGTSLFYEFEFHRGSLGDPGRIAGLGNDQAGDNVNFRAPNDVHSFIGEGTTDVNFYVVRIDFKDGNDDILVYRNPAGASEPATADLALPDQADMSFNGISFGNFVGGFAVAHDEIRLGETWASVTVPSGASPFTQWINGFPFAPGANLSEAGDPDGDGIVNLLEYALATAPNAAATAPLAYTGNTLTTRGLPLVTGAPGSFSSVFIRRKDAAAAGLTYTAQFSADLQLWQNAAAAPQAVASDADAEAVQTAWPATVPTAAGTAQAPRFFRVKVQF